MSAREALKTAGAVAVILVCYGFVASVWLRGCAWPW